METRSEGQDARERPAHRLARRRLAIGGQANVNPCPSGYAAIGAKPRQRSFNGDDLSGDR